MDLKKYLEYVNQGKKVIAGSKEHNFMHELAQEAMKITAILNNGYHEPDKIRELMSKLIGKEVDESFGLFPPFYTDCGKNIEYDSIMQSTYRLNDIADFIKEGDYDKNIR